MKQILFILILLITLSSCKHKKEERNVSIMQNQNSLINAWYGKDHFKPGVLNKDDQLNKNPKQESVEIDAGQVIMPVPANNNCSNTPTPAPSTTPATSCAESPNEASNTELSPQQISLDSTNTTPSSLEEPENHLTANKYEDAEENGFEVEENSTEIEDSISYHEIDPMEIDE